MEVEVKKEEEEIEELILEDETDFCAEQSDAWEQQGRPETDVEEDLELGVTLTLFQENEVLQDISESENQDFLNDSFPDKKQKAGTLLTYGNTRRKIANKIFLKKSTFHHRMKTQSKRNLNPNIKILSDFLKRKRNTAYLLKLQQHRMMNPHSRILSVPRNTVIQESLTSHKNNKKKRKVAMTQKQSTEVFLRCPATFNRSFNLSLHLNATLYQRPMYRCGRCEGTTFSYLERLTAHHLICINKQQMTLKPYMCNVVECGQKFYLPETLINHLRDHYREDSQSFEKSSYWARLGNPASSSKGKTDPDKPSSIEGLYDCRYCSCNSYTSKKSLLWHTRRRHKGKLPVSYEGPYRCFYCNNVLKNLYGLFSHVKKYHGVREDPTDGSYRCTSCTRTFKCEFSAFQHAMRHHIDKMNISRLVPEDPETKEPEEQPRTDKTEQPDMTEFIRLVFVSPETPVVDLVKVPQEKSAVEEPLEKPVGESLEEPVEGPVEKLLEKQPLEKKPVEKRFVGILRKFVK